jgi:hypothetical protein
MVIQQGEIWWAAVSRFWTFTERFFEDFSSCKAFKG